MSTDDGMVLTKDQKIGLLELYWMQGELMGPNSDAARRERLGGLQQTGLVIGRRNGHVGSPVFRNLSQV